MLYRYLLIALLGLSLSSGGVFARDGYYGSPRYHNGWAYPEYRYRYDGYRYYTPYRYRYPDFQRDFRHDWRHSHRYDWRYDRGDVRYFDLRLDQRRGMDLRWRGDYRD